MRAAHGEAFDQRCFTEHELSYAARHRDGGIAQLSARFAAKEAVLKALGTGLREGMCWTDIEVFHDELGQPQIRLFGAVAQRAATCGITSWRVSLYHTSTLAIASVMGAHERKD